MLEVAYILNDLSNKVCLPNKTEDLNLSKFNMVTGINELKTLTNYISCEFKYRFDRKKCKSNQWWNNDKCRCGYKKYYHYICERDYVWILLHAIGKMENTYQVLWNIQRLSVMKLQSHTIKK